MNIVDIPLMDDIKEVLKDVKKIHFVKLRFFPLNNDIDFTAAYNDVRDLMDFAMSDSANLILNSPKSKDSICELLNDNAGLVEPSAKVTKDSGEYTSIKPSSFTSSTSVHLRDNIEPQDDKIIFSVAKSKSSLSKTSAANQKLYDDCLKMIEELYNKKDDNSD